MANFDVTYDVSQPWNMTEIVFTASDRSQLRINTRGLEITNPFRESRFLIPLQDGSTVIGNKKPEFVESLPKLWVGDVGVPSGDTTYPMITKFVDNIVSISDVKGEGTLPYRNQGNICAITYFDGLDSPSMGGILSYVRVNATGYSNVMYAGTFECLQVAGTDGSPCGVTGRAIQTGGTSSSIIGVSAYASNMSGTATAIYGVYITAASSGTTTTGYGVYVSGVGGTTKYSFFCDVANALMQNKHGILSRSYLQVSPDDGTAKQAVLISTDTDTHYSYISWFKKTSTTRGAYMGWGTPGTYFELMMEDGNYFFLGGGSEKGMVIEMSVTSPTKSTKAILQLNSTSQGFLPPRMTTTQRDNITSPDAGLVIYNTTTTKLECYNGSGWQACW